MQFTLSTDNWNKLQNFCCSRTKFCRGAADLCGLLFCYITGLGVAHKFLQIRKVALDLTLFGSIHALFLFFISILYLTNQGVGFTPAVNVSLTLSVGRFILCCLTDGTLNLRIRQIGTCSNCDFLMSSGTQIL